VRPSSISRAAHSSRGTRFGVSNIFDSHSHDGHSLWISKTATMAFCAGVQSCASCGAARAGFFSISSSYSPKAAAPISARIDGKSGSSPAARALASERRR
jgi:hypothetical protein